MLQQPVKRSIHASFRNIVLSEVGEDADTGELIFLLHIGNRSALPPGFLALYCRESFGQRFCRWCRTLFGRLSTHPLAFSELGYRSCRIPAERRSGDGCDVFSRWCLEDAYTLLCQAGFYLYHAEGGWSPWTPYEIYTELVKRGCVTAPMNVLWFDRTGRYVLETATDAEY